MDFNFNKDYVLDVLKTILAIDSPTGFTETVAAKIAAMAAELGFETERNTKGNVIVTVPGKDSSKTVGVCAHTDTLGLMVRSIKPDETQKCGPTLAVTNIGGPIIPTLDGEYCKIYTRCGKVYTGTILSTSPASHVFKDSGDKKRDLENIEVRIDEVVKSKEDVIALGISAGDYVCYNTKTEITPSGFIKSRFLDDKLSVSACFGVLKYFADSGERPRYNVKFMVSVYEETGHGVSHIPEGISELLAVDMGCIGDDLGGNEYAVSVCAKDSGGPYDYGFTSKLIFLAKENGVEYAADIFPYYTSDISSAVRAGHDLKGALIGPGVHASHGMERSHYLAVENTMKLVALWLTAE